VTPEIFINAREKLGRQKLLGEAQEGAEFDGGLASGELSGMNAVSIVS